MPRTYTPTKSNYKPSYRHLRKVVGELPHRDPFAANFVGDNIPRSYNKLKKNSSNQKLYRSLRQAIEKVAGGKGKLYSFIPFLFPGFRKTKFEVTCNSILKALDRDRWAFATGKIQKLRNDILSQ